MRREREVSVSRGVELLGYMCLCTPRALASALVSCLQMHLRYCMRESGEGREVPCPLLQRWWAGADLHPVEPNSRVDLTNERCDALQADGVRCLSGSLSSVPENLIGDLGRR